MPGCIHWRAHARATGRTDLRGAVVPGDEPMLHLARTLGAEMRSGAAEVTVQLSLDPTIAEPARDGPP